MMIQSKINNHLSLIIWLGALYICRETFTDVMSALQIKLFMQNEPKFRKSQVNVTDLLTRIYVQLDTWSIRKNEPKTNPNEPKTNPNEPKFKKAEMNVTSIITKEYENKSNWAICENKANFNPKQSQTKPIYRGVASGEGGTNPTCRSTAPAVKKFHLMLVLPRRILFNLGFKSK